ncbi:MAG: type II toxin-antitoxin system RelB/DinJ family antitoxin [Verrucomicrobia bacterium]|nr:type II toxin-antitoxin system RelB/DinJ family antitoxin [Verrucomicrobiota bacterium]
MARTVMIHARMAPELKTSAEELFRQLGLSTSEAIKLFFQQVKLHRGIPFDIRVSNRVTRKVFDQTDRRVGVKSFRNKEELFKDLGLR